MKAEYEATVEASSAWWWASGQKNDRRGQETGIVGSGKGGGSDENCHIQQFLFHVHSVHCTMPHSVPHFKLIGPKYYTYSEYYPNFLSGQCLECLLG